MKLRACAVALALLAPLPAMAATIINHSFEDIPGPLTQGENAALDSWDYFAAIPGWTAGSGQVLEIQSANTLGYIDAHTGDHYVELDSTGNNTITQDVQLTAGRHVLTFYYAMRNAALADRFNGAPAADTNHMTFGVDGIFTSGITWDTSYGSWTEITASFDVATAGTYALRFTGAGTSDTFGALIDTVSIAHVPIPAAGLMLLTALGGAMALRRKP